jgi:hypothetical protein
MDGHVHHLAHLPQACCAAFPGYAALLQYTDYSSWLSCANLLIQLVLPQQHLWHGAG